MKLYLITETIGEQTTKKIEDKKPKLKSDIYCDLICLVNGKYAQEQEKKAQKEQSRINNNLIVKYEIIDTEKLTIKNYFEFKAYYSNQKFTKERNGSTSRNLIFYNYTKNKKSFHMIVRGGNGEELLNKIHSRNTKDIQFKLIDTYKDGRKYYREINYFKE